MNVPPGMGAEEFAAYCYARADPAELQAIYDRTFEKFSRYSGGVNSSEPCHPRIPPSNATSDRGDAVIGLPSPSASDSGVPVDQQIPPTAIMTGPGQAVEIIDISAGHDSSSSLTHNFYPQKPKLNGSISPKGEESSLLVNTRVTRSKVSSTPAFVQLDNTGNRAVMAGSTVATISARGKSVPSLHGFLLIRAGDQKLTEVALSKLACEKKRKRDDDDDEPLRKRGRTDSYSGVSSGELNAARVLSPTMTP